jgi:hypothetical protein
MAANPGSTPTWDVDGDTECFITRDPAGGTGTGPAPDTLGNVWTRTTYDGIGDFTDCQCCESIIALYEKCEDANCTELAEQYTIPLTLLPGGQFEQTIIIDDAAGSGNKCCYTLITSEECSNGLVPAITDPVPNTVVILTAVDCDDENCT